MSNILPFILIIIISVVFFAFSGAVLYHVGRYSFVGDYSKRYSTIFIMAGFFVILISLLLVAINHLNYNAIS